MADMNRRPGFTIIEALIVVAILGIAAGSFAVAIRETSVKRRCHDAGFPDVRFAGLFEPFGPAYCVKRVDQTDSVVALERVR